MAGPRINEVMVAGIQKITATLCKGWRSITAPGFNDANMADCKAAIEAIVPHAVMSTLQNQALAEGSGR